MDYIVIKDITMLIFMAICIGISFYSSTKLSKTIQSEAESQRDGMMELLRHSIDTIKSTSLEERVNAVALESEHEVKLEMLKDAFEQEKQVVEERDPRYAHTDDGSRINLNEYEVM